VLLGARAPAARASPGCDDASIRLKGICAVPEYDDDFKTWVMFRGDNKQFATLKNVEWCKRMDTLIAGI